MYKDLINDRVTVLVATRGDVVLEYEGTLTEENDTEIVLNDASIATMLMSVQVYKKKKNMTKYREDIDKIIINKKYIISCLK